MRATSVGASPRPSTRPSRRTSSEAGPARGQRWPGYRDRLGRSSWRGRGCCEPGTGRDPDRRSRRWRGTPRPDEPRVLARRPGAAVPTPTEGSSTHGAEAPPARACPRAPLAGRCDGTGRRTPPDVPTRPKRDGVTVHREGKPAEEPHPHVGCALRCRRPVRWGVDLQAGDLNVEPFIRAHDCPPS